MPRQQSESAYELRNSGQQLATRLARAEEGRGGPGRSPNRLAEGMRLMLVDIGPGSTQLLIASPPRDPQFDLGALGEEAVERAFGRLVDGLDAAAGGRALPDGYDDLSRRGLAAWLDALAQAAREVEVEGRVGAREPKTVRMRPAEASALLKQARTQPTSVPVIAVEGVLYAVNLHTGRYRIEDDMGSSIDLVTSLFTSQQVAPLLGQRVSAGGTVTYDIAGKIKEIDAATIEPAADVPGLDSLRFWRNVELDELLGGSRPLESIDDLGIPGLTAEEGDAFLKVISE